MPTTIGRIQPRNFVVGVDGCRGGWVFARLSLDDGAVFAGFAPNFRTIINGAGEQAQMIMVDMPIGLADHGRRYCELEARKLLRPLRHASVFSSPRRPMLDFETYEDANAWGKAQGPDGGGGLSKQAWMITPKIREIDAIIAPADQHYLCEGHPEVAFMRLNAGAPCAYSKRKHEGQAERCGLLMQHGVGNAHGLFESLRKQVGARVAHDDVYDACVLALSAKAALTAKLFTLLTAQLTHAASKWKSGADLQTGQAPIFKRR